MGWMLDTSVLIGLRDNESLMRAAIAAFQGPLLVSIMSLVELEGGVCRHPEHTETRRSSLDFLARNLDCRAFGREDATTCGQIVARAGDSRRKMLDRMIAAQALVAGVPVVTLNPQDFTDIPGLQIHALGAPA